MEFLEVGLSLAPERNSEMCVFFFFGGGVPYIYIYIYIHIDRHTYIHTYIHTYAVGSPPPPHGIPPPQPTPIIPSPALLLRGLGVLHSPPPPPPPVVRHPLRCNLGVYPLAARNAGVSFATGAQLFSRCSALLEPWAQTWIHASDT